MIHDVKFNTNDDQIKGNLSETNVVDTAEDFQQHCEIHVDSQGSLRIKRQKDIQKLLLPIHDENCGEEINVLSSSPITVLPLKC